MSRLSRILAPVLSVTALLVGLTAGSASAVTTTNGVNPNYVYRISGTGDLQCASQENYDTGTPLGTPVTVGTGWNFPKVFATSGAIYGIRPDGALLWYKEAAPCATTWQGQNQIVGWGFNQFTKVFGMTSTVQGSGGVFYAIDSNGNLNWYRHDGYATGSMTNSDGSPAWANRGIGITVGTGWGAFKQVFAGENGEIYAVNNAGQLLEYVHTGWQDGSNRWLGPKLVGTGWENFTQITSPGDGVIYAVSPDGLLRWYKQQDHATGITSTSPALWYGPGVIATGWTSRIVFANSFPPPTPFVLH